ncbi:Malonyl CoA-acyl carrier protein transacylase [hydrothermal vent metagenome]|uniref:Malonyl CoA-acyl carrier protein transacylase n=1 Tax=hydrothermal vent metagenome TaxID=652676 RepID=A0A3B0WDK4_9ZZZZ
MKNYYIHGAFGLLVGMAMSFIGFSDFSEIHKMFTLSDFRLIFTFMGAVSLLAIGFFIVDRENKIPRQKYHQGIIPGSILFGAGWAVTGSCPIISMIQLGEGKMAAVLVIFGVFFGTWAFRRVAAGLTLDTGVCGE